MSWMNQNEIEDARKRIVEDPNFPPHFKKAAIFLNDFMDLINSISDGWPYWSYGTKCSSDLQEIVRNARWPVGPYATELNQSACKKAMAKVTNFLKRCSQTKDKPEVEKFLETHDSKVRPLETVKTSPNGMVVTNFSNMSPPIIKIDISKDQSVTIRRGDDGTVQVLVKNGDHVERHTIG